CTPSAPPGSDPLSLHDALPILVQACEQINSGVLDRLGAEAERLGTIDRVTAERHGAIRVGTGEELAQVGRVFGACGMYPVGFYRSEEHTSELQSRFDLVCRLLL